MKIYVADVITGHRNYDYEHNTWHLGVFTTKEKAAECFKNLNTSSYFNGDVMEIIEDDCCGWGGFYKAYEDKEGNFAYAYITEYILDECKFNVNHL